jgi:pimeloyl-ACP methyl ester carboxylesterase
MSDQLTIVLVHGAFADSASWAPITDRLLKQGYKVAVPPGHSYGGAVITVAGAAANVVGLVFVSAYVLEEGESLGQLQGGFPDSELAANLVYSPYPVEGGKPGTDVSVKVEAFPHVFAAGVPDDQAAVLAASQRPLAAVAFGETATAAAWKTKPGWGIVAKADNTINPDVERFGYKRAGLRKIIEINSSHLVMLTHPDEVTAFITAAATEVAAVPAVA